MSPKNLNQMALDAYDFSFRRDAHQLVAWGYRDSLNQIHNRLPEEEITQLIAQAAKKRLEDPLTPESFDLYLVSEEVPLAVEGRKGKNRRKLDLVVISLRNRSRPEYVFEAKRLRKKGFPIGRYVGEEGLQCFVKGVYARNCLEAGMIAYLQSDHVSYWKGELKRRFENDANDEFNLSQQLEEAQPFQNAANIWVSKHNRLNNVSITIYHIFLDCSKSSSYNT